MSWRREKQDESANYLSALKDEDPLTDSPQVRYPSVPLNYRSPGLVEEEQRRRMDAMRTSLVTTARAEGWNADAIDSVLAAGGMEPYTKRYAVVVEATYQETLHLRATDTEDAHRVAQAAGGWPSDATIRVVAVRDVPSEDESS